MTTCQVPERAGHAGFGRRQRVGPREPVHVLALVGRRRRLGITGIEQVAQVEVDVSTATVVHVDVGQARSSVVVHVGEADVHPRLLGGFAASGAPRCLAGVEVTARLHPDPEPAMAQQHDAPSAHDEGRAGHVHAIDGLVERRCQAVELGDEALHAARLPVVDRITAQHVGSHERAHVVGCHHGRGR